jgi:hypothetical protein
MKMITDAHEILSKYTSDDSTGYIKGKLHDLITAQRAVVYYDLRQTFTTVASFKWAQLAQTYSNTPQRMGAVPTHILEENVDDYLVSQASKLGIKGALKEQPRNVMRRFSAVIRDYCCLEILDEIKNEILPCEEKMHEEETMRSLEGLMTNIERPFELNDVSSHASLPYSEK